MNNEEDHHDPLCTFAATGIKSHFQSIYLCHTCTKKDGQESSMPLCICTNCSENCHDGHDVEYVGEGMSYCDCSTLANRNSCKLIERSEQLARQLNLENQNEGNDLGIHVPIMRKRESQFPFVCDIYDIPSLRPCDTFIKQAQELIKHTRDTHWVSCSRSDIETNFQHFCAFEKLAYSIFQRHLIAYDLESAVEDSPNDFGAEWWVQVKETNDDAIDLHYDKDEELASAFDLGSFPTLSTVTYLTEGAFGKNQEGMPISAPPTLVFAHTHEMIDEGPVGQSAFNGGENEVIENNRAQTHQLVISHAREGKHLCFDGRLLHGASSDVLLRQVYKEQGGQNGMSKKDGLRVTFLVNIWLSRKPSGIASLQSDVRSKLKTYSKHDGDFLPHPSTKLEMAEKEARNCFIQTGVDRIMLPFVSTDATWIENEKKSSEQSNNEEVSGLVVTMFPPAPEEQERSSDTMFVLYDEGFEPILEHIGDDEEEDKEYYTDDVKYKGF